MGQPFSPDDDDQPTGLLDRPASVREESGMVRKEIEPALLEKLKPVDELLAKLETANYYELLGLAPGATRQEIRRSYSQLAKRFHPDVYFRKRIGDYGPKLERVFTAITRAYGVLIADEERRVYDLLGSFPASRPEPESAPPATPRVSAVVERVTVSVAQEPPPRVSMKAPATPRISSQPPGPSGADLAREALRRELSMRNSMPPRSGSPAAQSQPPLSPPPVSASTLDGLIAELEQGTGIQVWVAARLRETRARERDGQLMAALNILQLVLTRYPDPRLREQCARLRERGVRRR